MFNFYNLIFMAYLHFLEKEFIKNNYLLFGPKVVASKLKRSETSVINYAKELNLQLDRSKKLHEVDCPEFEYDLNFYNVFNKPITNELAYWLGFFWADGTINRESSLIIEITKEDGENVKCLFDQVYPFSITYRERSGRKPQMIYSEANKSVAKLLKELGKYPKSSESHEKIFKFLQIEDLQIYFLRGLIDGDGNFYINTKDKYAQFTLASNVDQDWEFLQEFLKNFHPHIHISEKESSKSSVLRITGKDNILNFIKYLKYETDSIGLTRKIEKVKNIIHLYN